MKKKLTDITVEYEEQIIQESRRQGLKGTHASYKSDSLSNLEEPLRNYWELKQEYRAGDTSLEELEKAAKKAVEGMP